MYKFYGACFTLKLKYVSGTSSHSENNDMDHATIVMQVTVSKNLC